MRHSIEIELDGSTVDEDTAQWWGVSVAMIDIEYHFEDVVEADTPKGPIMRQKLVIDSYEGTVFASDQWGGERETDQLLEDWVSASQIYDELDEVI